MTLYKAVRSDGTSFHDSETKWAVGETTRHPTSTKMVRNDAATYLSASREPADCTGFRWPCRLFEVEAVGDALTRLDYPNKVAALAFRVVRELPAHDAFGPNGEAVAKFIQRCARLTPEEIKRLDVAEGCRGGCRGGARHSRPHHGRAVRRAHEALAGYRIGAGMTTCGYRLRKRLGFTMNGFPDYIDVVCGQRVGLRTLLDAQGREHVACRHHLANVVAAIVRTDSWDRAAHEYGEAR